MMTCTFRPLAYASMIKRLYPWYVDRSGTVSGFDLFDKLLQYDPERRFTATEALQHPWFSEEPLPMRSYVLERDLRSIFPVKSPYPTGRLHIDTHLAAPTRSHHTVQTGRSRG